MLQKIVPRIKRSFRDFSPYWALLCYLAIISLFFIKPLARGEAVSPSDMIFIYDNYSYLVGEDYRPSNELLSDQTLQFEPWKIYAREQIRKGNLPWENPYQADGVPLIANDQSALFFPTNILFYFIDINLAATIGVIVRLTFAAMGTYLFLNALKIRKSIAFLGGLGFAFAGFNIVWLSHPHTNVSIFLPWLLFATHRLTDVAISRPQRWKYSTLLAVLILMQFLGGHVETSFHICLITGIYFGYRIITTNKRRMLNQIYLKQIARDIVLYSIPIFAGLLLASIQLAPFIGYLKDSYAYHSRSNYAQNPYGQPPAAALTWVIPNLYGNPRDDIYTQAFPTFSSENGFQLTLAPLTNFNESVQGYVSFIFLLLAPFALLDKKRRGLVIFLLTVNAVILLVTLRTWPLFHIITTLPLFDLSANHRLLLAFGLNNIILGCLSLQYLFGSRKVLAESIKARNIKALLVAISLIALSTLILLVFTSLNSGIVNWLESNFFAVQSSLQDKALEMLHYSLEVILLSLFLFLAFAVVMLLCLMGKITSRQTILALLVIFAADIFLYAYDFNPSYDLNERFPVTPGIDYLQENTDDEAVLFLGMTLPPNISTLYQIHDLRSYDAMGNREFTEKFYEAYSPQGSWELINYIPSPEAVALNNLKYDFNVKYVAVGSDSELVEGFLTEYSDSIVYQGPDLIVARVNRK